MSLSLSLLLPPPLLRWIIIVVVVVTIYVLNLEVVRYRLWIYGRENIPVWPDTTIHNDYVALCTTAKDEALNLPEFITHHYHHHGIRRFYIMDDGSWPPLDSFEYPHRDAITFTYLTTKDRAQHAKYHPDEPFQTYMNHRCHRFYGHKHNWIGHFDVDEYLEVRDRNETIQDILHEVERPGIGGYGINWRMHTSAGLLKRPESARKAFTECVEDNVEGNDNINVKSFVRPSYIAGAYNMHVFKFRQGAVTVGEDGQPWRSHNKQWDPAWRSPVTRNRTSLHHYSIKSMEEYEVKMNRSRTLDIKKTNWDLWNQVESRPKVDCFEMTEYNP